MSVYTNIDTKFRIMSISSRFARLVQDSYKNNDIDGARSAYYDWQLKNCLHPTYVYVTDSHTQQRRRIRVACGKCFHCQQTKINEWCTRMYAHAEDFKHVYFCTLTYRSITNPDLEVNRLFLSRLSQAVWHRDNLNMTRRLSYNPCLLVKKHYQDFLKRLRKYSGLDDLTYVLSGEYGSQYGRPHFHAVFFTNGELSKRDIERAWSVCLWKSSDGKWSRRTNQKKNGTAYNFPIGRVDFHDLVSNGTFNTAAKIKVDGSFMNAARCFAYVCKYVCKRDTPNLDRVKLAYRNLFHKENFVKLFDNEIPYKICLEYLKDKGVWYQTAEQLTNNLKSYQYEKKLYSPSDSTYSDNLSNVHRKTILGEKVDVECFPQFIADFCEEYRPFCEFSRGTPIGSIYAKRNLQEFTQGVFTKPLLQDDGFVVPSYFRRKAAESLYGLREIRETLSGTSYVLGPMQNLLGHFQNVSQGKTTLHGAFYSQNSSTDYTPYIRDAIRCRFRDNSTSERIVLCDSFARYFKYNRHERKYVNTRNIPVADFVRSCVRSIQEELERHAILTRHAVENERLSERAMLLLADLGHDPESLRTSFYNTQQSLFKERQNIYYDVHKSIE